MMPKGSQFLLENGALDLFFVEKKMVIWIAGEVASLSL